MKIAYPFLLAVLACGPSAAQTYSLNPSSLSFAAQANAFPPLQQTVTLTAIGPFQGLSVASNQSWLSAISPSSGDPRTFKVGVLPTNLSPGTFSGVVTVTVYTGASSSTVLTLPVTVQVTINSTTLQLSQQAVTMNYQLGQAVPPPQSILLSSSSGSLLPPLSVIPSTSSGGNWLTVDPPVPVGSGPIFLGLANNVVATLAPGTYLGSVRVFAALTANQTSFINVTLNVSGGPLLAISTAPATFTAQLNGGAPPPQSRPITATSGALNLSVTTVTNSGMSWLTATLNSSTTPATLTIVSAPAGLPIGSYNGSVTVSSSAGALTIPVTLQVDDFPLLRVEPREVNLSSTGGIASQSLQVRSSGTNFIYSAQASVTTTPPLWLSANAGNNTTPASVTLTADASQLENGTYFSHVDIRGQTTGDPRVIVPVTFTVNRPIPLNVSSTVLNFSQVQGLGVTEVQRVRVTSPKPVPFSYRSTATDWLTIVQSSAQTDAILLVSIKPGAALPVGNYTATITVSGPSSSSTAQIAVNLSVTAPNLLAVSRTSLSFSGRAGEANPAAQIVRVTSSIANSPLRFTATSDAAWLTASPLSGTTPASLSVAVNLAAAGASGASLAGRVTVTPEFGPPVVIPVALTIDRQPIPAITAVASSATYQPAALSAGMLCTIIGTELGPARAASGTVSDRRFTSTAGGVRVLFDGVPAPVLYASKTQINAAVPYQLGGRASVSLVVEYNGVASPAVSVRLVDSAPGIFMTEGGYAAALNENGLLNSAANPARAGTIVVLYVTGEGQTTPAGVDGEIVSPRNLKRPLGAVRVRVDGVELPEASVLYAGSAPELVSGLMQVNFRLPSGLRANAATLVEVLVGGVQSAPGAVIAVR